MMGHGGYQKIKTYLLILKMFVYLGGKIHPKKVIAKEKSVF